MTEKKLKCKMSIVSVLVFNMRSRASRVSFVFSLKSLAEKSLFTDSEFSAPVPDFHFEGIQFLDYICV